MVIHNKAFLFSLTSFLFIFLFGLLIFSVYDLSDQNQVSSVSQQAKTYQSYYSTIKESYVPIIIEISARDALRSLSNFSIEHSAYVPPSNLTKILSSLIANGTANVSYIGPGVTTILSENGYNNSFNAQFSSLLSAYDANIIYEVADITAEPLWDKLTVKQSTPWAVDITLPVSFTLTHPEFDFSDPYIEYKVSVSIIDLPDPLYGIESKINYVRNIDNTTNIINDWSANKLRSVVLAKQYVQDDAGLSFLMRLQNITSSTDSTSANIVSFINPYELNSSFELLFFNSSAPKRSFLDYHFFANTYKDCHNGASQFDYLYTIIDIKNFTDLNFRLDYNSTIDYLGDDFSDPSEYNISCSKSGVIS